MFPASAPLAGVGARQSIGLAQLQDYATAVRDYLAGLLHGSLGVNRRGVPVNRDLLPAARRTLELLGVSVAAALPLGLLWGGLLASARRRLARVALFGLNTLVNSLPSFVVMMLAIEFISSLTLRSGFRLTYVQGYGLDRHLILPTSVLALRGAAYMARGIQVAQEEILRQDWIRAARARGLGGLRLWRRHVLPALRLPLLGSALGMIRVVVTGLVIVDYMYNWNGLGTYMLKATGSLAARNANDQLTAGAGVLLVCLFVGIDALGRLLLRQADPRLRGGIGE
ncbi:MAG TPA: ABC transporter permease [Roseiflexaceae bacterium]|nr:ABC transporter permease [Roseiflexaceae bacterium]